MIISRKKYNADLKKADQDGVTRGYKMGYLMGQIEKYHREVSRLDRELEEIQHEKGER